MIDLFFRAVATVLGRPLNAEQRAGVRAVAGTSLFLVAGPGSGKTTVLALRVLKLIFVDHVEPSAIIATTFTRRAAKELRSRILAWGDQIRAELLAATLTATEKDRIAGIDFNAVWTGTLDSFAETVLGQYRPPGAQPPAVIEDFVAKALMLRHGLFDAGRFRDADLQDYIELVRGGSYNLTTAEKARVLTDIRQRVLHDDVDVAAYLTTPTACGMCAAHPHPGVAVVGDALAAYENFLTAQQIVDYAALEQTLLDHLQSGALDAFVDTIQHVLVDEYQDTNLLQEAIYFHLARGALTRGGSIAVVGDDDQALFRFRGATVELFRDLPARAGAVLGITPTTIYLHKNYRSTNAVVALYNDYIGLDASFQAARVAGKPRIDAARGAPHDVPVLGMFRDNIADLACDLASFVEDIFNGLGFQIPGGEVIQADPAGGVGDCAFLAFSPAEQQRTRTGLRPRLPGLLRQELARLVQPIEVFNPRGTEFAELPSVGQLCGLALECIDPGAVVQGSIARFPRGTGAVLRGWRADALRYLSSLTGRDRATLRAFVNAWQAQTARSVAKWPDEIGLADLMYKLVTWIPAMQKDVEGLVHLEVVLRTITEAARFSAFSGDIVFRDPVRYRRSVTTALWEIFAPLAEGAIEIDEDLLETLPPDRLNVLSIHQAKGLEFPLLVIVDVGSEFQRDHHTQRFKRFPNGGAATHRLEDELRGFSRSLSRPPRSQRDRAFDDLVRAYFVAFSRAQDVLLLVGHTSVAQGNVPDVAVGWDRARRFHWGVGLPNLVMI